MIVQMTFLFSAPFFIMLQS